MIRFNLRYVNSMSILGLLLMGLSAPGAAQTPAAVPLEPIAAILDAFNTHQIVALGEGPHGNEQAHAFRVSLIRDRRFVGIVSDILVESGNARHQDVMDRYANGDAVSHETLRRVWEDTTVPGTTWDRPIYEELYRTVREVNSTLAPARRLRVLLGDPPIDWSIVRTADDVLVWQKQRDTYPAGILQREVIAKKRRALVIYGDGHLVRAQSGTLVNLVEASGAPRIFTVMTDPPVDLTKLQASVISWRRPSIALVRDTVMGAKELSFYFGAFTQRTETQFDAFLYLGAASDITMAPLPPSLCAEAGYIEMRMRRFALTPGQGGQSGANRLRQYCASVKTPTNNSKSAR